ncbi:MAG: flagellar biosynthesis protein FlgK [Lachnospiraceae bacterium]|nr:flagellar biosynthesis protein FlgK [Lachnospiraceae bacterium]
MIRATFAGFSTALSALQANQKRLDITGQNLSNMNTTGYTRQTLDTSSLNYSNPISHYMNGSEISVGFGVAMDRVSQIRDPFLDAQYRAQMEKSGYTDALQTSLDSLSHILDESKQPGIRKAFDDIQSVLTNLQDPSKVNDAVYESELRTKMEALTNLLNDSAKKLLEAREQEYQRLDGEGTNQNGAEQTVNDILERIGKLNRQIKHNQVFNQPSLELQDERNVLLDELASYIPIEITYYKEDRHIGDKDWPDDVRVDMIYYKEDANGALVQDRLTLVNGSEGAGNENYGQIKVTGPQGADTATSPYLNTTVSFTGAASAVAAGTPPVIIASSNDPDKENAFSGGSIQAALDMLGGTATTDAGQIENVEVRSYQYYMNHLDNLAAAFSTVMNELNKLGNKDTDSPLMVNRDDGTTTGITASNIRINPDWANGIVKFGKGIAADGNNATDTAKAMLGAMSLAYSGDAARPGFGVNLAGKSFADYINNVSTILATDSYSNQNMLKTNVTVLNGIQDSRDSVSGISLDEEAANMMTYLSAYNAASRLMTTMDEALNTLINNTGLVGR